MDKILDDWLWKYLDAIQTGILWPFKISKDDKISETVTIDPVQNTSTDHNGVLLW